VIAFVDTSVVLRYILEGDIALHQAFQTPRVVVSELLRIEARRVLERHRLNSSLDDESLVGAASRLDEVYESFEVWDLSDSIKKRAAGPFPTAIGSLDAIHVSTAIEALQSEEESLLLIYSYGRQMNLCAKALGFAVPLFQT
jgi:predicted nucleic acid-binding protein